MDKPKRNLHFRLMSLSFKLRDLFSPRMNLLKEVVIKPGFHILDYGCGPGSYVKPVLELVGNTGKIYALDIHHLAIQKVHKIISKNQLSNVETILSDCKTGLPDKSIDVVLIYDAFHEFGNPDGVLVELHRVLKPDGILSLSDHHMKEEEIISKLTKNGLYKLSRKGKKTYSFLKEEK